MLFRETFWYDFEINYVFKKKLIILYRTNASGLLLKTNKTNAFFKKNNIDLDAWILCTHHTTENIM